MVSGLLILFCIVSSPVLGQNSYRSGLLPTINLNQKFAQGWRINYQWQSRWILAEGVFSEPADKRWAYSLSDLSIVGSKKVQGNKGLAIGFLTRFAGDQQRFRLLQQYTSVEKFPAFRLGHRIRTDQTWGGEDAMIFRLRYRLSFDVALNGSTTNQNELYFKLNHEYLTALEAKDLSLEIRMIPMIGLLLTDNNKLETGLDYRFDKIGAPKSRHSFWWAVNWYYSFGQ